MNEHLITLSVHREGWSAIEDIYPLIKGRGFIAGSYAAWLTGISVVQPNDIDIFAMSEIKAAALAHAIEIERGACIGAETDLLFLLSPIYGPDIQIIKPNPKWQIWPDDLIEDFDLSVCRAVLIDETHVLADEGVGGQVGKFIRINDPLRSLKRALKYHQRGIHFEDWELCKLFRAWEDMSPEHRAATIKRAEELAFPLRPDSETIELDYFFEEDDYFDGE